MASPTIVNTAMTVPAPTATAPGNNITATTFNQMIDVLDALVDHSHTFNDDYTSNCQCNCGRGSL